MGADTGAAAAPLVGAYSVKGSMMGTFSLPLVERPTATVTRHSARLHSDLASLGGQRSRIRGRVCSGSTNRPTAKRAEHQSGGPRRTFSAASSKSSRSSEGNGGLTFSRSSSSISSSSSTSSSAAAAARPSTVDPNAGRLSIKRPSDRLKMRSATDKLNGKKLASVRHMFRTLNPARNGRVDAAQLREGLKRYCFWMEGDDVERLMGALNDPRGDGCVEYNEAIELLRTYMPLGPYTAGEGGDALLTTAPWEPMKLKNEDFVAFDKLHYPPPPYVTGQSYEATNASDQRTFHLVNARFYQSASRIRHVFRKLDTDRNGVVCEEEFVAGVSRLGLAIPEVSLRKFFSLIHDGSGKLDYVEFLANFDGEGEAPRLHPPERGGPAIAETTGLDATEVENVAAGPKGAALRERLASAVHSSSHAPFQLFRRYDQDGDGLLSMPELTRMLHGVAPGLELTPRDVASLMVDIDPGSDGFIDYKDFATKLALDRPPHPRASRLPGATDPLETGYQGMQGGARHMYGASCLPHGPGEPPVNHPTVASIVARTNAMRTEQRAPALESLWDSLSEAAATHSGAYADGKPTARRSQARTTTLDARSDNNNEQNDHGASPVANTPAPGESPQASANAASSTRRPSTSYSERTTSKRSSRLGFDASATFGFGPGLTVGPSPGAPGGPKTGIDLDPRWAHAKEEGAELSKRHGPYKPTMGLTVPAPGVPSAWDPLTHYYPKPGVGAPVRSTTVEERAEQARARERASVRFSGKVQYLAQRQATDEAKAEALDAARVASKSHMRRRDAERTYFYSQFGATPTDKESHTFFMRKF